MQEVNEQWPELLKKNRATPEQVRAIQDAARMHAGPSLVSMSWLD